MISFGYRYVKTAFHGFFSHDRAEEDNDKCHACNKHDDTPQHSQRSCYYPITPEEFTFGIKISGAKIGASRFTPQSAPTHAKRKYQHTNYPHVRNDRGDPGHENFFATHS